MSGPGTLLANRYRLDDRVGGGGMGEVWRATDQVLGRSVAVKLMRRELVAEPGFADRFLAEARTMATIRHPGVVGIHDYHGDAAGAFLVMEYVEGESLAEVLHRSGRLDPARAMRLMSQAAEALQAAHDKGVVHRDIKPGNLLVTADDTLVLTDFGIARSAGNAALTAAGAIVGTPQYLSPEQVLGRPATARSDLYALGVVGYECLTGQRPFDGDNPFEIAMKRLQEPPPPLPPTVPPAVRAVLDRALATEPEQRWATAREMASATQRAATAGASAATAPAPPAAPTRRDYAAGRAAPPRPVPPAPPPAAPLSGHHQPSSSPPARGSHQPPGAHQQAGPAQAASSPSARGSHQAPGAQPGDGGAARREQQRPRPAPRSSPPPWAAQERPVPVALAAGLLLIAALGLLGYSLATFLVADQAADVGRELAGSRFDNYHGAVSTTLLVLTAGLAAVGLAYLLIAVQVFLGRRGSRGWAFTLGLPLLGCCAPGWWYAQLGLGGEVDNEFTVALRSSLPAWYESVSGPVAGIGFLALLLGLVILMLPSVGRYLRRSPGAAPPPYHHQ
ncbi:serine/threonine protein kinase [Natronosporangium hydrolyticum]|uniref:non-specific serine/threonine protein kinase n=1 Tax=Natronosporangium hydrolyticum TaxID=2811111 RepID=A0A895YLN9_9ACTN|nr:serine/threonine-protein kinase [Natronosporangium hydrolyticum]QSB15010.1 serine/threonine protein kinase [Natronosporangium hydrolyticum]